MQDRTSKVRNNLDTEQFVRWDATFNGEEEVKEYLMVNSSDRLEKMGEIINNRKEYIKWLTVSTGELTMKGMVAECKIHFTARSKFNANGCVFIPLGIKDTECAIEVFANSSAIFNYCSFTNAEKAALIIRDCSYAEFNYCVFSQNEVSVLVTKYSQCKFNNCFFIGDKNISVLCTNESSVQLDGCKFMDCNNKGVFCNFTSFANIICCTFKNMEKGVLTIANKSECDILYSNINKSGSTAMRSIDSKLNCFFVTVDDVEGNIVNMENSTGIIQHCNFMNAMYPLIAVIGSKSNPIFDSCNIADGKNHLVVCRMLSVPTFYNCNFSSCKTALRVDSFSYPSLINSTFADLPTKFITLSNYGFLSSDSVDASQINTYNFTYFDENRCLLDKYIEDDDNNINNNEYAEMEKKKIKVTSWISPSYVLPPPLKRKVFTSACKNLDLLPISFINEFKELNEEKEDFINVPCGHFCNNNINNGVCAICGDDVKEVKRVYEENECVICLSNKCDTIFLPCGHLCTCRECALNILEYQRSCPLCDDKNFSSLKIGRAHV